MDIVKSFLVQDEAVTAIEYALIGVLISVAILTGVNLVSTNLANKYNAIQSALP